jgi:hypothetical protein
MQIRFWGVRGSIAVPNRRMLRYGGNTSCVARAVDSNERRQAALVPVRSLAP